VRGGGRGGADWYGRSLPLHPDLQAAFVTLMRALRYTGVGMLEFKMDFATGAWTLLELNARFWASLPVATAAGADFPWYLYQLLIEGRREFPQTYRTGVYCRNWGRDLVWLKENFLAPREERVPLSRLARELAPLLALREHSDTFPLDDPAPGVEDIRRLARRGRRWIARQATVLAGSAPPLRRLRAAHARRALTDA